MSENDIGPKNFSLLQKIFVANTKIEYLNIADCLIDGNQTRILCRSLKANRKLQYFYLRNCDIKDVGSEAIAELIENNDNLKELEVFKCAISSKGGRAIEGALRSNFCIEKLSIGDNHLGKEQLHDIQQSVIFNTQYNQMKDSNRKFEGFAHKLIAESLKEWASKSTFVQEKLNQRLHIDNKDELDALIAECYFSDTTFINKDEFQIKGTESLMTSQSEPMGSFSKEPK